MVEIVVYVEGGVLDSKKDNKDALTMSNTNALREELNRFFSRALDYDDIRIIVRISAGYKNAAKFFINEESNSKYLYVDLDRKPEFRDSWFEDIEREGIVINESDKSRVFFWIQEMEAWFLKQPQAIERWADDEQFELRKKDAEPIGFERSIYGKDIERLQHKPSYILANILKSRYLSNELDKNGKRKKLIYGKLKHSPGLISQLDEEDLKLKDSELISFLEKLPGNN